MEWLLQVAVYVLIRIIANTRSDMNTYYYTVIVYIVYIGWFYSMNSLTLTSVRQLSDLNK